MLLIASPYVAWLSANSGYLRWEGKSIINGVINAGMTAGKSYQEAAYGLGPNLERLGLYLADEQFQIAAPGGGSGLIALAALRDAPVRLVDIARNLAAPSEAGGPRNTIARCAPNKTLLLLQEPAMRRHERMGNVSQVAK